jgi:hypothetical protein
MRVATASAAVPDFVPNQTSQVLSSARKIVACAIEALADEKR